MSIGLKIKQKKFRNEYHKATANLFYTASCIALNTNKYLKEFGITLPQYNILRILRGQFPKSVIVNLIIERMLDKSSNVSRILDKLGLKALINRKTSKTDRRIVEVIISKKGLDLLQKIDQFESDLYFGLKNLDESEIKEFNRLLDKVRELNPENQQLP